MAKFSVKAVFEAADEFTKPISKMQKSVFRFTGAMERGFRRANKGLTKLADKMRTGFKRAAIVLGSAVTSVGLAIRGVANRADELAKQARVINMPIEDLQKYQFVAEQSGISSDSLTKSLGILDKQIGQAKTGTGTLVTILKKSNPQLLRQLMHTKNTAEAFKLMNKAIKETKDPTQRAALAFAAYGRQGLSMINMAKLSTKEFNKLTQEAEKNGIITEKQAEAAEAFNDQMNSLKHTVQGVLQDAILPLMPALKEYLKLTQNWIIANKKLIETRIDQFIKTTGEAIKFLVKHGAAIAIMMGSYIALMAVLRTFIVVMTAVNFVLTANPIGLIVVGIGALIAAIALLVTHWKKFKTAVIDLFNPLSAITKFFDDIEKKFGSVGGIISRLFHPFSKGINVKANVPAAASIAQAQMASPQTTAPIAQAQMISPQARTAAAITEKTTTNKSEVTIKDQSGKAEVTKGKLGNGVQLVSSGAF